MSETATLNIWRGTSLPLPACGERVGVRGRFRHSERSGCGNAPSPGSLRLPTSPRTRGEVQAAGPGASLAHMQARETGDRA